MFNINHKVNDVDDKESEAHDNENNQMMNGAGSDSLGCVDLECAFMIHYKDSLRQVNQHCPNIE